MLTSRSITFENPTGARGAGGARAAGRTVGIERTSHETSPPAEATFLLGVV